MSEEQKKAAWPRIAGWLVLLSVLYVLSFGPACWFCSRIGIWVDVLPDVYRPVLAQMHVPNYKETIREWRSSGAATVGWKFAMPAASNSPMQWYSGLGAAHGWFWCCVVRIDADGQLRYRWVFAPPESRSVYD
jgi:hypothetical protein